MKKRYWLLLLVILVLVIITFGLLIPSGFFKSITPHFDGETVAIYEEAHGTEDLDIDHQNGILFISSTNRRLDEASPTNGIYALDLNNPTAKPYLLSTDYSNEMFLHGISVITEDSTTYLYAINHLGDDDFIELFKYQGDSILYVRSFSDPLMISPNDIVGISNNEFYITNDHTSDDPAQDQKEDFLRFKNRNIIHYKNGQYTEVANELAMPNGINISNNQKMLYCATTLGHQFITYERDMETGSLSEISRMDLDSGLDNIDVDVDGNIWVGSHPKVLKFLGHVKDATNKSPSQIFKLTPKAINGEYTVEEVYSNDGSEISASSVGVRHNDELFIGAVFDQKIFRGRMN